MSWTPIDPEKLTADLVRCASVTPRDAGAIDCVATILERAGFTCVSVARGEVRNLFARWGDRGHRRTFGFNGHTDVVPPGDPDAWTYPPFSAESRDGRIWGRGAVDMKSGVAAFVAAAADFVQTNPPDGALVLAITGDEEGDATDGTRAILDWMTEQGESMTDCLVGEPTCPNHMGEMMKVGRRGSMTAFITVTGAQGHTAYPHRARNAAAAIAALVHRLAIHRLDEGTEHFDPSTLAVTTIDVGNPATNVVPGRATAAVNIRFNDLHSGESLTAWLEEQAARVSKEAGVTIDLKVKISGESFLTPPGDLSDLVAAAVEAETGVRPQLSTTGGTSDARFVKDHCPVVEFGLVGQSMHQVDEHVEIAQIHQLKAIYSRILRDYFKV